MRLAEQNNYMCSLFRDIVRSLVDDREPVVIEVVPAEGFAALKVRASHAAISMLTGPKGQMARAVRTLLTGSSSKLEKRYALVS